LRCFSSAYPALLLSFVVAFPITCELRNQTKAQPSNQQALIKANKRRKQQTSKKKKKKKLKPFSLAKTAAFLRKAFNEKTEEIDRWKRSTKKLFQINFP